MAVRYSADDRASSSLLPSFPASRAPSVDGGGGGAEGGWRWSEPVLDDRLCAADRAIMALARVASNLSDKAAVERAASSQGLSLVTSSDVALRPLLPPFGSTVDEDGEAGDGMALALPQEQARGPRASAMALAEGASALIGSAISKSKAAAANAAAASGSHGSPASEAMSNVARMAMQKLPHSGDPASSWLVADDPAAAVRYIVVCGGRQLRRATPEELRRDLVAFESYSLGAKVNRRLYGEAVALYDRFMPLMMDFLEAQPQGSICFGGQGVGGALAVLLQLMAVHRGVRFARLLPAVAVGAPAVLAQVPRAQHTAWGPTGREQRLALDQDRMDDVMEELMSRSVLEELGLPQDAVRNLVAPPGPLTPAQQQSTAAATAAGQQQHQHQGLQKLTALHLAQHRWVGSGAAAGSADAKADAGGASQPVLVMASSDGDGAAVGVTGGSAAAASPAGAQLFRMVGKIVQLESAADASNRRAAAAMAAAADRAGGATAAAFSIDSMSDTDQMAAAAATATAAGSGSGARERLDVTTMGSIAGAAAAAAASAAVEQLRHVGAGALRAATAGKGAASAVAVSASAAASAGKGVASAVAASASAVAAAAASSATSAGRRVISAAAAAPAAAAAAWSSAADGAVPRGRIDAFGAETDGEEDQSAWGV
ncbi:hypothetical protein GPECTOR_33g542 [Gonium pectorale]|uniref:Fungal lipase-type domain-containing protein n=1 Tax=Gonium pectorale TaxID=33097 RepID=A0A150GE83_GONPE|nr:hypothetical protein GPECTOR_33g542 [Gonium pectorale]|eukprot:KXZ47660.1 hypothetical protein GPECTOR_33g542 [Gonium pectorale]